MASPNKDLKYNEESYVKLGKLLMLAHVALLHAHVLSGHMMTLQDLNGIDKAMHYLDRFRSKSENVMAHNGMEQKCIATFWGGALEDSVEKITLKELLNRKDETAHS